MTKIEYINQLYEPLLLYKLRNMARELRTCRDEQELIACNKEEACICNRFDNIIDSIENLITEFKINYESNQ